jgi:hypothetical protein
MARIIKLPWGGDAGALGATRVGGRQGKNAGIFGKIARKLSRVTCIDAHGKFANYSKSRF